MSLYTEVRNVVASLKNSSSGYDEFPPFVGKSCVEAYIELLTHLINLSLKSGVFPSEFKLAKVIPIFKAGDTSAVNNYRPISVLSFFSKVFEKIVYNHVLDFIDDNNGLFMITNMDLDILILLSMRSLPLSIEVPRQR